VLPRTTCCSIEREAEDVRGPVIEQPEPDMSIPERLSWSTISKLKNLEEPILASTGPETETEFPTEMSSTIEIALSIPPESAMRLPRT
jgi:hypothetical protein